METTFNKGDKVRVIFDPYCGMAGIKAGDIGTVTSGGVHCVGVKFGKLKLGAMMTADNQNRPTIEKV